MGHLAFLGSHKVNGVSALHTELMRETVFRDLHALYPDRIVNKTNGITFRRWLQQANPRPDASSSSRRSATASARRSRRAAAARRPCRRPRRFQDALRARSAGTTRRPWPQLIAERIGVAVDPAALFDVQIKRIHEYKRQLLNILETVALYHAIRAEPHAGLGAAREDLRRQGGGELPRRPS